MRAGNLPHRASFVFLHNSAGKLFVQQRVAWKETYPSHHDPAPVRRTPLTNGAHDPAQVHC